ncbi:MAG: hypothetical protein RLZ35_56, partial [Pseudomonadota bacterium]
MCQVSHQVPMIQQKNDLADTPRRNELATGAKNVYNRRQNTVS